MRYQWIGGPQTPVGSAVSSLCSLQAYRITSDESLHEIESVHDFHSLSHLHPLWNPIHTTPSIVHSIKSTRHNPGRVGTKGQGRKGGRKNNERVRRWKIWWRGQSLITPPYSHWDYLIPWGIEHRLSPRKEEEVWDINELGVHRRHSAPRCHPCALFRPNEELVLESWRGDNDNDDAREEIVKLRVSGASSLA